MAIVIEPHGGLNATAEQVRDWVRRVDRPNFRVGFDAGNILYYSDGRLDPAEQASLLDGLVTGFCVKDFAPLRTSRQVPAGRIFRRCCAG